jgi:tetratricopeptide (TPR) repeat protein
MIAGNNILSLLLQLIILFLFSFDATAQSSIEKKKIFAEAESFRLFNEYEKAKPLYLLLDKPDNYNIKYKIGTCYLNILSEKEKAIPYLESAVKHSSYNSKTTAYREKKAPLDSYIFLAKAYMINNELEKALNTFQVFKKIVTDVGGKEGMENFTYVDQQVLACINGMNKMPSPFSLSKKRLGQGFRQDSVNENPAVSFDGKTLVYTEHRGAANAIMFSKKIRGKWQTPVEITSQLKAGDDCSTCSLNKDGTMLYLYKTDNFDGNIYSAAFVNGNWTPIVKLNNNINTGFYESHAAVSSDDKKLYFTSNREGGYGGLDIYVSEKNSSGDWGPAINLGNKINSSYNEETPFITLNDSLLYFSSEGHSGVGGYDIFRSRKSAGEWNEPENLGYPLNSTDDDKFFQTFNNDENGFYSMTTD